jgi:hypothetical protein
MGRLDFEAVDVQIREAQVADARIKAKLEVNGFCFCESQVLIICSSIWENWMTVYSVSNDLI